MSARIASRALIADDHSLYRMGLAFLLKDRMGLAEVIEVGSFDDALDRLAASPDIAMALFDLSMPGMGGPESLTVVKETYPDVKVAVVSGSEDREHVMKAVSIGLSGYVPKSLSEDEIAKALQLILDGHVYIPNFMTATAKPRTANVDPKPPAVSDGNERRVENLTPRQRDVLKGILRGLSNKEVARDLDIAEGTVKIHLAALFVHFSVRNRTELATRAQTLMR